MRNDSKIIDKYFAEKFEKITVKKTKVVHDKVDDDIDAFKKLPISMPWLVPACGVEPFQKAVEKYPDFFKGLDVHGLVFTPRNHPFDILAYDVLGQVVMAIECKIRSTSKYTKCPMECLTKKMKSFVEKTKKEINCHALLIVLEDSDRCVLQYQTEKGKGKDDKNREYLRAGLLAGVNSEWPPKVTHV